MCTAGGMSPCALQELYLDVCCRRYISMCTAGGMSLCVLQEVCLYVHCRRYVCALQEVCLYVHCRRYVSMCIAGGMSLCVLQEVCLYVYCRRYVCMCTAGGMSLCVLPFQECECCLLFRLKRFFNQSSSYRIVRCIVLPVILTLGTVRPLYGTGVSLLSRERFLYI